MHVNWLGQLLAGLRGPGGKRRRSRVSAAKRASRQMFDRSTIGFEWLEHRWLLALVEIGPIGNPVPANLALGGTPFAKDVLPGVPDTHAISHLNDALYGNSNSWIGNSNPSFVGVDLNGSFTVNRVAFGRDNLNQFSDRDDGTFTLQYTTVANPDAATPAGDWTDIETLNYSGAGDDHLRHLYEYTPFTATGVRIVVSNGGSAIDEIEVYEGTVHETTVSVSGNDLLIQDTGGGNSADHWSFTADGTNLTFTDINGNDIGIVGAIAGSSGDGTASITVPLTSFSGTLDINSLAGDDNVVIGALTLLANQSLDVDGGTGADTASVTGAVISTGTGAVNISMSRNVLLSSGSSVSTANGSIALDGNTAGTTAGDFNGVELNGAMLTTTGLAAGISLTGTSGTVAGHGVRIADSTIDTVWGTIGIAGNSVTENGVRLDAGTDVSPTHGNTTITGITTGDSTDDDGVFIAAGAAVTSIDRSITITGTSGTGDGVEVHGTVAKGHGGGTIIEGTGGGAEAGIEIAGGAVIGEAAGGPITLKTDELEILGGTAGGAVIQGTGRLTIQPRLFNTTIGIGDGAGGTLNIDSTNELAALQDGFSSITIGNNTSAVDINNVTFTDPVTITGGVINDGLGIDIVNTDSSNPLVTLTGDVSPGQSPGILNVSGNFVFADDDTFSVEIGGTTPGETDSNHDQLNSAGGTVTIGSNVTLNTTSFNGYVPTLGDAFTIIANDGADAIVGTFAGLPEAAVISDFVGSGLDALVSYKGLSGSDNDVVLFVTDVPARVLGTTPDLTSGTLSAGATTLGIEFSEPVIGADQAANYELRGAGPDGLLGNGDDVIVTTVASYAGSTAILTFGRLDEDVYRLTVEDAVTDLTSNLLDGDGDGSAGGDHVVDFVLGAETTAFTSPNGFRFDPEIAGFGAGQLVQGTNNAFDGLNRLQVDGSDFAPSGNAPAVTIVGELSSTAGGAMGTSFAAIPGLSRTFTVGSDATPYLLSSALNFENGINFSLVDAAFFVDGVQAAVQRYQLHPRLFSPVPEDQILFEDYLLLDSGSHTIDVRVREESGSAALAVGENHTLRILQFNEIAPAVPAAEIITERQSTSGHSALSSSFFAVPGLSHTFTVDSNSTPFRLSSALTFENFTTTSTVEAAFYVDNVQVSVRPYVLQPRLSTSFPLPQDHVLFEDYLELSAGSHTVEVRVREIAGNARLAAGETHTLKVLQFNGAALAVPTVDIASELESTSGNGTLNTAFFAVPGLSHSLTVESDATPFRLSSALTFENGTSTAPSIVEAAFFVDNVQVSVQRYELQPRVSAAAAIPRDHVLIEDYLLLDKGSHTLDVRVREVSGLAGLVTGATHTLKVLQFKNTPVASVITERVSTSGSATLNSTFLEVPGLSHSFTVGRNSTTYRLSSALNFENASTTTPSVVEAAFFVDDVQVAFQRYQLHPRVSTTASFPQDHLLLEDYLTLDAGTHTVDVRVRGLSGATRLAAGETHAFKVLQFNEVAPGVSAVDIVTERASTAGGGLGASFVPVLSHSFTVADDATPYRLSSALNLENSTGTSVLEAAYFVDGVQVAAQRYQLHPRLFSGIPQDQVLFEDYVLLDSGSHTVDVRVREISGGVGLAAGETHTLKILQFNKVAPGVPGVDIVAELAGTNGNASLNTTYFPVTGLSQVFTVTNNSTLHRFSSALTFENFIAATLVEAAFFVNNVQVSVHRYQLQPRLSGSFPLPQDHALVEDYLQLDAGTYTVDVRVREVVGSASLAEGETHTLKILQFNEAENVLVTAATSTLETRSATMAGLNVRREVTVPTAGAEDFARTLDVFENPTGSAITVPVRYVGNLGSDAATTVITTSDGDAVVETTDQWILTDDADGSGAPATVHLIHGERGLRPFSASVSGDNIEWTYNLTVDSGQTARLAHFTIQDNTRAGAVAAVNALVGAAGFQAQAGAFLASSELGSIENFVFHTTTVRLDGDDLLIEDTDGGDTDDTITISTDGSLIRITDPNNTLATTVGVATDPHTVLVPLTAFSGGIIVNTLGGDDSLTIDWFGGANFARTINFNGGTQTTSPIGDTLSLVDSSGNATFATATFNYTNEHDGSVAITGNQLITYTGLEPITSSLDATSVTLNYSSTSETITVTDAGSGQTTVDSDVAGETTTFNNPTSTLSINAGNAGNDVINMDALAASYPGNLTINGGSGTDTVNLNAPLSFAAHKSLTVTSELINAANRVFNISTAGSGRVNLTASRNLDLGPGSNIATVDGGISLNANTAGTTVGDFNGIELDAATLTTSGNGNISLTASGGIAAGQNRQVGVLLDNSVVQSASGGGTITIDGTGGTGNDEQTGVLLDNSSQVTSNIGAILIEGDAGIATGQSSDGVRMLGGSSLTASGTATITIIGRSTTISPDDDGVQISGGSPQVDSVNGSISITGTSAGGNGVLIDTVDIESSGSAAITIVGTASSTAQGDGVKIAGSTSDVRSTGGSISLTGNSVRNDGVEIEPGASVSTSGNAAITIQGTTSGDGTEDDGVIIGNGGITNVNGEISITGTSGTGDGVDVQGPVSPSGGGSISIRGTGAAAETGIEIGGDAIIGSAAGTGSVTLTTDGLEILAGTAGNAVIRGTGPLTITPLSPNTTIGIGDSASGTLHIDALDELAALQDGFSSITIGDATAGTGAVDITSSVFHDSVTIVGDSIVVTGLNASGNPVTLTARAADITDGGDASTDVTGTVVTLNAEAGSIGASGDSLSLAADTLATDTSNGVSGASYVSTVLGSSPVGYWRLGDPSGTSAVDASGNGNAGTYNNGVVLGVSGALLGNSDTAVGLDGNDDFVQVPRLIEDDFTIEFWLNTTQNTSFCSTAQWWCGAGLVDGEVGGPANDFGVSLRNGQVYFGTGDPPNSRDVSIFGGNVADGNWHHVVATRDQSSGALELFVDGQSAATGTGGTTSLNSPARLTIGQLQTDNQRFAGEIDEVAVYTSVLSDTQIQSHYQAGVTDGTGVNNGNQFLSEADSVVWQTSSAGTIQLDTGQFNVAAGETVTASGLEVGSGAVLGGIGTVNAAVTVNDGGGLAAGFSSGVLSTGELVLDGELIVELVGDGGPGDANGHDQINVAGAVSIDNSTALLTVDPTGLTGSEFSAGSPFVVISNDGTDSVTGSFAGLGEGAVVHSNFAGLGLNLLISYQGGSEGNDVVLILDELPTLTDTTPDLSVGALAAGATTLDITFSEVTVGADQAANYELRRAGPDGLLGNADDVVVSVTASYSGLTATLTFAPLSDDIYRLTVDDAITDSTGNFLDGEGDGSAGGDYATDFVVGANTTTLISPNGFQFDPGVSGFGTGQLVQGTNNAFDGLNRLQVGGIDFAPTGNTPVASIITELESTTGMSSLDTSFTPVPGLSQTFSVDSDSTPFELSSALSFESGAATTIVDAAFFVDGTQVSTQRLQLNPWLSSSFSFPQDHVLVEDYLLLDSGSHTVDVRVREASGAARLAAGQSSTLKIIEYAGVAPATPAVEIVAERASTSGNSLLDTNYYAVPGLSHSFTIGRDATPYRFSSALNFENFNVGSSHVYAAFFINNVLAGSHLYELHPRFSSSSAVPQDHILAEDYVVLNSGTYTVDVRVREFSGIAGLATGETHTLKVLQFNEAAPGVPAADIVTEQASVSGTGSLDTTYFAIPGLSHTFTVAGDSTPYRLSSALNLVNGAATSIIEAAFFVDGNPVEDWRYQLPPDNSATTVPQEQLLLEDYLLLDAGSHTVDVRVREVSGFAGVATNETHTLRILQFGTPRLDPPSLTSGTATIAGLNIHREVTVPATGAEDFARTLDVFENPTASPITVPVHIVGNLGSDSATTVITTSDGDSLVEVTDQWILTDDADGSGAPAVAHIIHGPNGVVPSQLGVIGDNLEVTYGLTVPGNETVRLAHFTVLNDTRAGAIAAANTLVGAGGFGGQAAAFLTPLEAGSIVNFRYDLTPPVVAATSVGASGTTAAEATSLGVQFSEGVVGGGAAGNFELRRAGNDGLLGSVDDVVIPLNANVSGAITTLTFAALAEDVYRLTVDDAIRRLCQQSAGRRRRRQRRW